MTNSELKVYTVIILTLWLTGDLVNFVYCDSKDAPSTHDDSDSTQPSLFHLITKLKMIASSDHLKVNDTLLPHRRYNLDSGDDEDGYDSETSGDDGETSGDEEYLEGSGDSEHSGSSEPSVPIEPTVPSVGNSLTVKPIVVNILIVAIISIVKNSNFIPGLSFG